MTARHDRVVIIGSGPAGYTAAIYAARAMLRPLLIEGIQPGGQLTTTTEVENYPGFAEVIQGPWLMEQMRAQALHVGAEIVQDTISSVDFTNAPFTLNVRCRRRFIARRRLSFAPAHRPAGSVFRASSDIAVMACRPAQPATAFSTGGKTWSSSAAAIPQSRKRFPNKVRAQGDGRPSAQRFPRRENSARRAFSLIPKSKSSGIVLWTKLSERITPKQ